MIPLMINFYFQKVSRILTTFGKVPKVNEKALAGASFDLYFCTIISSFFFFEFAILPVLNILMF